MNTRLIKQTVKAATLTTVLVASLHTTAQDITAADYIAMDLQARQLTVDGVRDRLSLLQLEAGLDLQLNHDAETQKKIEAIYLQHNMTSSSAIAWATKHSKKIADWLENNPDKQAEYDRIARELDTLSTQIQALANR